MRHAGGGSVSITTSEWRLDGVQAGTGATFTPDAGDVGETLSYHETATETGGTAPGAVNRSVVVGVVAAEPVFAPDAFTVDMWAFADPATDGDLSVTINSLPANGGATITDIEYSLDDGSWVSSGGIASFTISGLTNDISADGEIRAVNSVGAGPDSDVKSATPTAPVAVAITTSSGAYTVTNYPEGNISVSITDADRGWTDEEITQSRANGSIGTTLTTARLDAGPDFLDEPIIEAGPHTAGDTISITRPLLISNEGALPITETWTGQDGSINTADPDAYDYTLVEADVGSFSLSMQATDSDGSRTATSNSVTVNSASVALYAEELELFVERTGSTATNHPRDYDATAVSDGDTLIMVFGNEGNVSSCTVGGNPATLLEDVTGSTPAKGTAFSYLMPVDGVADLTIEPVFADPENDITRVVLYTNGVVEDSNVAEVSGGGGVGSINVTPNSATNIIVGVVSGDQGTVTDPDGFDWSGVLTGNEVSFFRNGFAASVSWAKVADVAVAATAVSGTGRDAGADQYALYGFAIGETP